MTDEPNASAWSKCMHDLADAGDRLAARLREQGLAEADVDTSVALLGSMMAAFLTQVSAEADHPAFLPTVGYHQHVGTPNPDTVYRTTAIDGSGTYRLTGDRGTVPNVTFMPFGGRTATGLQTFPPFDLATVDVDADGHFDILLSAARPAGHTGDWWQLDPGMRTLMFRSVTDDWGHHREPLIAIARLDAPARRVRASADDLRTRFAAFSLVAEGAIVYAVTHADQLRDAGTVNRVALVDYSANGGLAGQWYHEGLFDFADGDALLVETTVPAGCDSFSLSLTDRMFCTVDWVNAQSSLNRRQATFDDDGILRVVVAHSDPGVPNWLDTTGYAGGVLQFRWTGCAEAPTVTARVVALDALRGELPASTPTVTADERDESLRERKLGAQLRSLW
jgi:hypothetical protein